MAELEGFISDRTKAALAAAKRHGKKLGGFRAGAKLTAKARQKGADANTEAAAARAIAELQASGATSRRAIARALNDRGIPTTRGGKWFVASVRDVIGLPRRGVVLFGGSGGPTHHAEFARYVQ